MKVHGYISGWVIAILTMVILSGGGYLGAQVVEQARADALVRQCELIDMALVMYSRAHTQVLPESVSQKTLAKGGTYLDFQKAPVYPKDLQALGVVRDEQGFFSKTIDLTIFDYSVSVATDGSMTYQLGVHMPNGYYYKSPRSGK